MGPRRGRLRGDHTLTLSLAAALAPALAPASTPPPSPAPRSPLSPRTRVPPPPQPEWARLAAAVTELFAAPPPSPSASSVDVFGRPDRLLALQNEVTTLLRGQAAALVPDFLRGRVLPSAMRALVGSCAEALQAEEHQHLGRTLPLDEVEVVLEAWGRLWRQLLPALLAVFVQVRASAPGVRALALLAFRDEVVLPREAALATALATSDAHGESHPAQHALRKRLAHPLLVVAQAAALGGPSLNTHGKVDMAALRVETLLAQCVSPLMGIRGRYEEFRSTPAVPAPTPSPEVLAVRLRENGRACRPLLRPLSVAAGQRLNTLSELFTAAAAAQRLRSGS